jgi:LPS export ABC transporter protein LptC
MASFKTKNIKLLFAFIIVLVAILWVFQDDILKVLLGSDNNQLITTNNTSIKNSLEKLSDSELILKAIGSGYRDKIKFVGNQGLDNNIPSYKKDLSNREELIEIMVEAIKADNLDSEEAEEELYLEKIESFLMKEYSKEQILLHTLEASTYLSFKDSPIQLQEVTAKTYDKDQQVGFILSSNSAEIMKSGEIFFNGEVNIITKNGVSHQFDTDALILLTENGQIISDSEIIYLGEHEKIISQGMEINQNSDNMYLNGEVEIKQDTGSIIDTSNLFINHNDGNKTYQSKKNTIYSSLDNVVNSENGINVDTNKNLLNLLGKVNILGASGSTIDSYNLTIDQSNGGEVFKSNDLVYYQSSGVSIKAKKMYYDTAIKKIELTNEVSAIYD